MKKIYAAILLLVGSVSLGGCGQVEQATTEALEKAKQSAIQALEEASQSGSTEQAKESASQVLKDARQQAAELLGQASEFLAPKPSAPDDLQSSAEDTAIAL